MYVTNQNDPPYLWSARVVVDIFAGSNTTGEASQDNTRRWIAFESERKYLAASALRFTDLTEETHKVSI